MQMSEDDLVWIAKMRPYIHVSEQWLLVHSGFESCRPPAEQELRHICRIRYLDETGAYAKGKTPWEQPANSVPWQDKWPGPGSVVYGHAIHNFGSPRVQELPNGCKTIGIDTGAVFGGCLTALVFEGPFKIDWVSLKTKKEYVEPAHRGDEE